MKLPASLRLSPTMAPYVFLSPFVILVSEQSGLSEQTEREAERASHYKKRIVPVRVANVEPGPKLEYFLAGRQWINFVDGVTAAGLDELAAAAHEQRNAASAPATTQHDSRPAPPALPGSHRKTLLAAALVITVLLCIGYLVSSLSGGAGSGAPRIVHADAAPVETSAAAGSPATSPRPPARR